MPIVFICACGETLSAEEAHVGQTVRCPSCNGTLAVPPKSTQSVQPLNYAGGGGFPAVPSAFVRLPTEIPAKLRSPGRPPCYLVFDAQGAHIVASFDVAPALQALAESFAKKLKKRYDVQISSAVIEGAPGAYVRLVHVDEGNQMLRYIFTFLAGKTVFEVEGHAFSATQGTIPFRERHKGSAGLFGGAPINLLKLSAKAVGSRIAKKVLK